MAKGIKGELSKEKLLTSAARLFVKQGYHATGINEILSEAGLTKGSFYFYFSSKKELVIELAAYHHSRLLDWVSGHAREKTWEMFVAGLAADMRRWEQGEKYYGCPLAVLGMELAFFDPEAAHSYYLVMKGIEEIFCQVLVRSGLEETRAVGVAHQVFALYEGYLMLYRISHRSEEIDRMEQGMDEVVKVALKE